MDRGAWWAAVHGVTKNWTRLSNFTFTFLFHALEKEMATHSSVLAWRIPGMAEPDGLPAVYGVAQSQTWLKRLSISISMALLMFSAPALWKLGLDLCYQQDFICMEIYSLAFKYPQHIKRPFALLYVFMYLLVCNNNHDLQRLNIFWELMICQG